MHVDLMWLKATKQAAWEIGGRRMADVRHQPGSADSYRFKRCDSAILMDHQPHRELVAINRWSQASTRERRADQDVHERRALMPRISNRQNGFQVRALPSSAEYLAKGSNHYSKLAGGCFSGEDGDSAESAKRTEIFSKLPKKGCLYFVRIALYELKDLHSTRASLSNETTERLQLIDDDSHNRLNFDTSICASSIEPRS